MSKSIPLTRGKAAKEHHYPHSVGPQTIIHLGLDEAQQKKLRTLALLSRRTQLGVLRLLIDDATPEQLGVRQPEEKPA